MERKPLMVRAGEGDTLKAVGAELRFLCRAEDTGKAWSLMETLVPRDAGPPPHFHAWDEAYYVISGEVEFEIAGDRRTVRGGDFVYAPGGTVHAFHGLSHEPARMLIFDAPAHAEAFFKEMDREIVDIPGDLAKLPAIAAAHGVNVLPPPEAGQPP